ncbi:MAG TPA: efflux RND transporter periplasmic adaptor subunit [Acidiferrobacterales bacterium]|nr:efflux RND transporter periplasmic adaptor subunit [Acidiferrobacterales bacterium]
MKSLSVWFGLPILLMAVPAMAADVEALVQWSRRTELTTPVSGVVASVAVNAGERAAKGQLLLTLDDAPFRAAVQEAEAQLARRKSERDEAARDAKQAQELYDRTVLSTVELENVKMKLARADAGYKEASAALDRARYRLRVSALRAPFDAVVLSRQAEPGQSVAAELKPPVLLVIAAAGEYLAQARVAAERIAGLKPGQALSVVAGGKTYAAQLKALAHEPAGGKEPYVIEALFTAAEPLHAGQPARIQLP